MPDQWMTIAEAAAALRVHPRTVERRISANKIDTHLALSGSVSRRYFTTCAISSWRSVGFGVCFLS